MYVIERHAARAVGGFRLAMALGHIQQVEHELHARQLLGGMAAQVLHGVAHAAVYAQKARQQRGESRGVQPAVLQLENHGGHHGGKAHERQHVRAELVERFVVGESAVQPHALAQMAEIALEEIGVRAQQAGFLEVFAVGQALFTVIGGALLRGQLIAQAARLRHDQPVGERQRYDGEKQQRGQQRALQADIDQHTAEIRNRVCALIEILRAEPVYAVHALFRLFDGFEVLGILEGDRFLVTDGAHQAAHQAAADALLKDDLIVHAEIVERHPTRAAEEEQHGGQYDDARARALRDIRDGSDERFHDRRIERIERAGQQACGNIEDRPAPAGLAHHFEIQPKRAPHQGEGDGLLVLTH